MNGFITEINFQKYETIYMFQMGKSWLFNSDSARHVFTNNHGRNQPPPNPIMAYRTKRHMVPIVSPIDSSKVPKKNTNPK